ncbi:MAG: Long-chain fatty acid--CoA ligase [Streptosporangiaceae bacterium]|nr:Long-chain fatty acid--CoA ligase [Streptosporangiaceae bacterium]
MIHTDLIRPVPDLLAAQAGRRGGAPAYSDPHRSVTYAELHRRTGRLATNLAQLGLERGERVALYLDNSVETVESYLALTRAALVGVCLNPDGAPSEIEYMIRDSGAKLIITDEAHLEVAARVAEQVGGLRIVLTRTEAAGASIISFERLATTPNAAAPDDSLGLDEPAWMVYTSGTTGRPKGVQLTQHSCLWVVAACWAPIAGLSERDRVLCPLPLFHSYALVLCVLGVLATGASEHILPKFSVTRVLELLRNEPYTVLPGVPTMFHYLLEGAGEGGIDAMALRYCVSAGAIMPGQLNTRFEAVAGVPLLDGYGITETSTMVTMNWPTGGRTMGSCGLPLPGLAVRIVDSVTEEDVAVGADGELWVRGPGVMLGYHNQPDKTAEAMRNGWYRTGDLARSDADGYITISGRTKELIIRGGENIYPAEVEEALLADEAVTDVAVVAQPHDALGEVPFAFVVPRDPADYDPDKSLRICKERLSQFKVPERIVTVETIPRTGSGKVMRFLLQRQYTDSAG